MAGGVIVWCTGVGGVWCGLLAIASLLAAIMTPNWAQTREPMMLPESYASSHYPGSLGYGGYEDLGFDNSGPGNTAGLRSSSFGIRYEKLNGGNARVTDRNRVHEDAILRTGRFLRTAVDEEDKGSMITETAIHNERKTRVVKMTSKLNNEPTFYKTMSRTSKGQYGYVVEGNNVVNEFEKVDRDKKHPNSMNIRRLVTEATYRSSLEENITSSASALLRHGSSTTKAKRFSNNANYLNHSAVDDRRDLKTLSITNGDDPAVYHLAKPSATYTKDPTYLSYLYGSYMQTTPSVVYSGHLGQGSPRGSSIQYQDDFGVGVREPRQPLVTTVTFRLGLWTVCPLINTTGLHMFVVSPPCSPVSYLHASISQRDFGLPAAAPVTQSVVARIRVSSPFLVCSCGLLVFGSVLAMIGRCCHPQASLLATLLYALAGLSTGVAVVWFLSVVTEEFVSAARQGTAWSTRYNFRYGWSLLSAAVSAAASLLAALCTGHAHMARYSPWRPAKFSATPPDEGSSKPLMKARSDCYIAGGRSFTSDTIRTYLTNDSRRQFIHGQSSCSSSHVYFHGPPSAQSLNDASSLVDLTKQVSNDSSNEFETQETTIEVIPRPHCSRHMPVSKSDQFRSMKGTYSLPHSDEFVDSEIHQNEYQIQQEKDMMTIRTNSLPRPKKKNQKMVRQISLHGPPQMDASVMPDNLKDICNADFQSPDDVPSSPQGGFIATIPSPIVTSTSSSSSSTTSSYTSKTLPRRPLGREDLPRLPEYNSFTTDVPRSPHGDVNALTEKSFSNVEPPDLFNTNKNPEVTTYSTLPHGSRNLTVFSKKGNVRAATLTRGNMQHLSHV